MSLLVWLPLNKEGDFTNKGLADITLTNSGATYDTNGKIGGCYLLGKDKQMITNDIEFSDNKYSICTWVKVNSNSGQSTQYIIDLAQSDQTNTLLGLHIQNTTLQCRCNNDKYNIAAIEYEVWNHMTLTYDGNIIKCYLNGQEMKSVSAQIEYASGKLGIGRRPGSTDFYSNANINDVRVYDHCLSPKEVKEISKGLVLHYPLNSQYEINKTNFYSGDAAEGNANSIAKGLIKTKLVGERGYNYKLIYTGTGTNYWAIIEFTPIDKSKFIPGKKYTWSCKIRIHKCTAGQIGFRNAIAGNDYTNKETIVINTNKTKEVWTEYNRTLTMTEGMNIGSGFYYITEEAYNASSESPKYYISPRVEFCTANLNTKDTIYEYDFDIKDVQLIESDEFIGFIDNSGSSNTVHDISGYHYDGTVTNQLSLTADTPRYDKCTVFANNGYIRTNGFNLVGDQVTVSMWIKQLSVGQNGTSNCYYLNWNPGAANGGGIYLYRDYRNEKFKVVLALHTTGTSIYKDFYPGTTASQWDHVAVVVNKNTVSMYRNGTKVYTTQCDLFNVTSSRYVQIGNANNLSENQMSDVRIYATALSDDDILELYNTPAFITNNSSVAAYMLDETQDITQVTKSGIINSDQFYEESKSAEIVLMPAYNTYIQPRNTNNFNETFAIVTLEPGKSYTIEFDVIVDTTFAYTQSGNILFQGTACYDETWGWSGTKYLDKGKLKAILASDPGTYHVNYSFSIPIESTISGERFGYRVDYSDETGKFMVTNLKIYETKYAFDGDAKFGQDYITANQLIEI